MSDSITYNECLMAVAGNAELVREYDRLCGTDLSHIGTRSPLVAMIDEATGYERDTLLQFMVFVFECIYLTLHEGGGANE